MLIFLAALNKGIHRPEVETAHDAKLSSDKLCCDMQVYVQFTL